jgi:hypothetical protein
MPARRAEPAYSGHHWLRRGSHAGAFRFKRRQRFLSDTWLQDRMALEETGAGMWSIYFYEVPLGRLDRRSFKPRSELSPMVPV